MTCRSGCPTGDHSSYGECLRAANIGKSFGATFRKWTESELSAYRAARAEGIQPAGTTQRAVNEAKRISDRFGKPFDAATGLVGGDLPIKD